MGANHGAKNTTILERDSSGEVTDMPDIQAYGEDFADFMHRGVTQRSSLHCYLDLFCYQAPSSRWVYRLHAYAKQCLVPPPRQVYLCGARVPQQC